MKRLFDFVIATILLLLFMPLMIIISFLIIKEIGMPFLFMQMRPGLKGKTFIIYKFRTMTNQRNTKGILVSDELRLTKFGKFLRSTSLDELPSLYNVLIGEMSLVGPRPLLVDYLPLYSKTQARRHEMLPGITGWAQINGRNNISWDQKFELDVWYIDNHSVWLDIKILLITIKKVIIREGINDKNKASITKFRGNL